MLMMVIALTAALPTPKCSGITVQRMVGRYGAMVRRQDSAGIAHLFGMDGMIDNPGAAPIRGEAAIRTFLASFKGAVVRSEALTLGDVKRDGPEWNVTGRFHQTGRTPDGKDYDVSGSFDSAWTCTAAGWRVRRMSTGK